jgi:RluA family pseudouridine synthase
MAINRDRILYEDQWFLGVLKLPGELVVRGKGKLERLPLFDFLKKEFPGIHPLNRLDFETSGVVVFAKGKPAMAEMLARKYDGWKKTYRTIVMGRMAKQTGTVLLPLPARAGGEKVRAETRYRVLERYANSSYIEVDMITGRHHQIRRHMAMIGHPLVLDKVYGNKKFNGVFTHEFRLARFFLHAMEVEFPHPYKEGETVKITAPLPETFTSLVQKLGDLGRASAIRQ